MHESGAIEKIIKVVKEKADPLKKIVQINLSYGKMTGIVPDHIEHHFREHVKGTPLENIELNFKESANPFKELYVESIEVE